MARLGTQYSPTGRDRSHEELGVLRANFQALLERRGIQDYAEFQRQLNRLNEDIQRHRAGNPADLMARGGIEAARQDMQRFFDQFIARVTSNPRGIHAIARVINPGINIDAFETSPGEQFNLVESQQVLGELRNGNGPFDALRLAVQGAENTDLYVLFSLYTSARTVLQNAQNPAQAQNNEAQIQELERQRAHLTRVNDEVSGAYQAFNRHETNASVRTWASRAGVAVAGAAMAVVMGGVKLPSFSTSPSSVNVTVNVGTTVSFGHSVATGTDGTLSIRPANSSDATKINGSLFQMENVQVKPNGDISGTMIYVAQGATERQTVSVKKGENTLPGGKKVTLERTSSGKLKATFEGTSVEY